ncbi:PadR family transcriptional regulator [Virgibacillus pantothenticus]|uniref:PadR family transcriptional regulator n=1 Tax=Virgibacillus pantothenticus TaxID=1473 RepID=A0A0L0QUV4_VIRPA|nr:MULTISPECIES: PadR family transcriptional regulator [Virgibacillus]API92587.1 PadR family transcriptional regulator [Virgibacillus sp. 6R]KNE22364.1 PadR family transcriptional regulator [Virgibacillus pantothenticus]MBS7428074.1 PadR family transcriptional regulator [Virgibacillus sp. 19R1-5]MBU8567807.1 PadR family transcriptional regulator [Virgibacillus pantothenticus]MBU8601600.1 PadR family transcriptional regulator [Virgibacillus pantothenticus]
MSVRYGILTLLSVKQHHGYELKIELDSLLGLKGKINPGQIYTTLDRLTRDGLVTSPGFDEQDRRLYDIHLKGKEELNKWLIEPVAYSNTKEDFFFKWSCARRTNSELEKMMLTQQKELIVKEVMELTKLKTELLMEGDENRYLLVTGTLLHLEADLTWINQVENRAH